MKKTRFLALLMIGLSAAAVFTGCKKDEDNPEPKPTVSVEKPSGKAQTVTVGETFEIKFTASSNNELKKVTITHKGVAGTTTTVLDSTVANNTTSFNFSEMYDAGNVIGTEVYTITVRDKDDLETTEIITITVKSDIQTFTATILGNQHSSTGSFYNVIDNVVMSQANAKANAAAVDFVYYHGATNQATIAAPDDAPAGTIYNNSSTGLQTWSVRNATRFKSTPMTAAQFDNVSTKIEIETAASGSSLSAANMLAVGNVFAFITDASHGGKSGLAKVIAITGDNNTAGTITFDVKIEE